MLRYEVSIVKDFFKDDQITRKTEIIEVSLPEGAHEVTLRQYVDLLLKRKELPNWFLRIESMKSTDREKETAKWTHNNWIDYYVQIAKLLSVFLPKKVSLHDTLNEMKINEANKTGHGILAMYLVMMNAIAEYQPKERESFTHKGKTFVVPKTIVDAYGSAIVGAEIKTVEAIEALQFEHVLTAKDEEGEFALEDHKYHSDIAICAALCRMVLTDGRIENMPLEFTERRRFMDRRIQFFESLTMDVAIDVAFFLTNSSRRFLHTHTSNLHSRALQIVLQMRKES